jgi:trigger factor
MAKYTIKKAEDLKKESAKRIDLEIDTEEIKKHSDKALKSLSGTVDIAGFRKGHVPEKVILERLGEAGILEEAINSWVKEAIAEILEKEAPEALTFPEINITKAVPGNAVELSLFIPLRPKLVLPDYKKIAVKINSKKETPKEISEKDIDEAVTRIRKYAVKAMNPNLKEEPKEDELPPLTDQFAESIGGGKTVAELRERIKKDLEQENKTHTKEKNRLAIIEAILKETEGAIPTLLIHHETDKMEKELENDVKRMGLSTEDYLKSIKKTHEELHKEWHPVAEKRAKVNLILSEIKKLEKIEVDKKAIDHEVEHFLEHYKDADKEQVYTYFEHIIGNEKVFDFLEALDK